jgi:plastocyanin
MCTSSGDRRTQSPGCNFYIPFRCSIAALSLLLVFSPARINAANLAGEVQLLNSQNPVARKQHDFSGVVIWLEPMGTAAVPMETAHVRMIQKDKRFQPHILPVGIGSVVDFPNFDPIFHNAFSNFSGEIFDIGLYAPGTSRSIRFRRPGVVRVFCNIHPSMSAVIVVLDTPYFAATARTGKFTLSNVLAGEYELHVLHERALPETLLKLTRKITVNGSNVQLSPVLISEAGYLPTPHKNKYGKDYPPDADSQGRYSSLMQ